jgi:hypothetical protein
MTTRGRTDARTGDRCRTTGFGRAETGPGKSSPAIEGRHFAAGPVCKCFPSCSPVLATASIEPEHEHAGRTQCYSAEPDEGQLRPAGVGQNA